MKYSQLISFFIKLFNYTRYNLVIKEDIAQISGDWMKEFCDQNIRIIRSVDQQDDRNLSTILIELLNEYKQDEKLTIISLKNLIAQVSTGEGKSLIIATIMIIKCVLSEKEHFYGKRILDDQYENGRKTILVDEVDSMLLDKENCVLYLAHQPSNLDSLESVYVFIWQMIVLNIYKLTKNRVIIEEFWNKLNENNNIDESGKILLSENIKFENENLNEFFLKSIEYLFDKIINHEKQKIQISNYLKSFVEQHLTIWIQSGIKVFQMEEGRNYIINVNKTLT
ncbi:unnamed protein product [Didymodactylos carnosus]|uniref:Uncharacterized protein n=1 Tax=Didymodactylos carnosus TaxID=1234261 RepID=A0A815NVQ1_9BILA|nr:unnamed protein product [Didymodactylos carnosus]CAF4315872.1 unnamed protein product [Didymodactylos carnosus]